VAATLTRRTLLATTLPSGVVPRLALGQAQSGAIMKIECAFGGHVFTAALYDNPSAHDLASMLPLNLAIEDYSNNEKIAHLPRRVHERGAGRPLLLRSLGKSRLLLRRLSLLARTDPSRPS
jgi:Cyclophilin-like family